MSRAELFRALAALAEPPTEELGPLAEALGLPRAPTRAEHTDLFVFELHPYASVHLGPEGQLGGVARDRVAGFFRALGVEPVSEPDHLVVLLSAYAQLLELGADGDGQVGRARTALLHEHLAPWAVRFAVRATELGAEPYARWGELLAAALDAEVRLLGEAPTLPAHLREAPDLPDPREDDGEMFVQGLLAPVRSGLVLARVDLLRAGTELDLGVRVGERAFMLRSLLGQDAAAILSFLAVEAARQRAAVHGEGLTADFWRDRLTATAALLRELAREPASAPALG